MSREPTRILLSELAHVVDALQPLVGRTPGSFHVPTPWSVVLEMGRALLLIEVWPLPRVHTIAKKPPAPPTPYSFQALLRARCEGPILEVRHHAGDRALSIVFPSGVLLARLYGRGGGIWWMEAGRAIAASDGPCDDELPAPPPHEASDRPPRFVPEDSETWDLAARRWFEAEAEAHALGALRAHVGTRLDRRLAHLKRLTANLRGDLDAASHAQDLREDADCLAAELWTVKRGQGTVTVPDIHRGDGTRTLRLDPARSPSDNLSRMYAKAGRLERAQQEIARRLEEADAESAVVAAARATVTTAELTALRGLIRAHRLPDLAPARPTVSAARQPWVTWVDDDQRVVRVGRDAAGNHRLVFREARGRDLWIHLRDRPSAHVVITADRTKPPADDVIAFAVELALRSAKVPEGQAEDVRVARVADLRPVPGGGAGQVTVTRERVVRAAPRPKDFPMWRRQDD